MEVDVCATGPGWLDAALEPLVAVVAEAEGEEGEVQKRKGPPTSGEVSAAAALVAEALHREEQEGNSSPLLRRLPAVVGATLGGGCVHVALPAVPGAQHCSPLAAQPRHMREHLNGNALYLATSAKFQKLARVARAVAGERDELPFDLALWVAAEILSDEEEQEKEGGGEEEAGAGAEEGERREEQGGAGGDERQIPRSRDRPPPRFLLRNPRMLNLGRRVEASRVEDAIYHGGSEAFFSLVHAPRRLRVPSALEAATAAAVAAPLPFAPPLTVVVVPRAAAREKKKAGSDESEEEKELKRLLLSSLVAHAARSLSSSLASSSSFYSSPGIDPGALPVYVALDAAGFEAASRATPYSVLFAPDFLPPASSPSSSSSGSSPLRDAAAVVAVVAALSRNGSGRGILLLSSPAVAAPRGGAALGEALLGLQQQGSEERDEGGDGRQKVNAPALLVSSPLPPRRRKRGGGGGGRTAAAASSSGAAASLPEMLWVPPSDKKAQVSRALSAWSRALAKEAERRAAAAAAAAAEEETVTTTATTTPRAAASPLSLLAAAASSARVAVERLPRCVFARSSAWKRARTKGESRGGGGSSSASSAAAATLSVRLVSFDRECRRSLEVAFSTSSAAACARERLVEAGLWKGGERKEGEEDY